MCGGEGMCMWMYVCIVYMYCIYMCVCVLSLAHQLTEGSGTDGLDGRHRGVIYPQLYTMVKKNK